MYLRGLSSAALDQSIPTFLETVWLKAEFYLKFRSFSMGAGIVTQI